MYTLLCNLCDGSVQVVHNNWLGILGFIVVVIMLAQEEIRKAKAKKAAGEKK